MRPFRLQENLNKLSVLTPESLQQLVAMLHTHAFLGQNALQVMAYLEILVLALTSHTAQDNDKEVAWFRVRPRTQTPESCKYLRIRSACRSSLQFSSECFQGITRSI